MSWYQEWAPYIPVAQRKAQGIQKAKKRLKKGETLSPIRITGNKIATTFWGIGWCEHLEKYSDFSNRLPRGRTYARNGSIADLRISKGKITAMVCGSDLYQITITITELSSKKWRQICAESANSIHSIIDLMRGKLGDDVIRRLTDPKQGMFPSSSEIRLSCNCPDGARLCKHLAATLYGVGHRLDSAPELLFLLRGVDQKDLVSDSIAGDRVSESMGLDQQSTLAGDDLGEIFGIDLVTKSSGKPVKTKASKKSAKKKSAKKKSVTKASAKKKTATTKTATKKAVRRKPATKEAKKSSKKTVKKSAKRTVVKAKAGK